MSQLQEIDIKNYRRIRRAHLIVQGNTIVVSGLNEQGKSSFLNAIENLLGGKDYQPAVPVRKGAKEAQIIGRLKTKDGRTLKATVTITAPENRRVLTVEDETTGAKQSSPQALLASFWDELTFDPTAFLAKKADEQVNMLKGMAGLDFTAKDKKRAELYAERTKVNTAADAARARLATLPAYPDAPAAEESSGAIIAEIEAMQTHNNSIAPLDQNVQTAQFGVTSGIEKVKEIDDSIASCQTQIDGLLKQIELLKKTKVERELTVENRKKGLGAAQAARLAVQAKDVEPLKLKLAGLETANAKVRANAARTAAAEEAAAKAKESDRLTSEIDQIDEDKAEAMRSAKFPVEGLSFNENGVMFDGLPLDQASDMRRVAIGVEMAAKTYPDKRIMLVRHGNFFDEAHFPILNEIAEKNDLTCVVEVAGPARADSSIVFVDGVGEIPNQAPSAAAPTDATPA